MASRVCKPENTAALCDNERKGALQTCHHITNKTEHETVYFTIVAKTDCVYSGVKKLFSCFLSHICHT